MDVFSRIIASRLFAWMALVTPGIVLLVIPTLNGELGIDPLKELFHRSGEIAVWTLGAVLCLSPLKTLFPRSKIVNALNRHRRSVGVTAFIYALLHVNLNFIYEGGVQSYFASILEPFFLAGTCGFLILLLLSATSNDWSVRKLGFALWKWIHRLAYLAALVLFYHQGTASRGNWGIALALFIPVASLEALRISKLKSLAATHENVRIHFAYSRPSDRDRLGAGYNSHGRIGIKTVQALVPNPYGDFFLCGPTAFMKEIYEDLVQWGVEIERIHFECFGPATVIGGNKNSPTTEKAIPQIRFSPDSDPIAWDGRSTLLDLALNNGLKPKYGCRSGVCGTCVCKLLRGKISYLQIPAASSPKDTVLLCCARPESDVVLAFVGESRVSESKKVRALPAAAGFNYRCFRPQS
jgi:DMSO/TMAO reductase YedYZ heme-binding membrane subunit/ferredoxin